MMALGSAARIGDNFLHAAWLAGVVMIASNSIGVNPRRVIWRRRRRWVRSIQVTMAIRSCSRVCQRRRSKTFFCSRLGRVLLTV